MKKILIIGIIFILIGGVFCGVAYAAGEKYMDLKLTNFSTNFSAESVSRINIGKHIGDIKIVSGENSGELMVRAENVAESGFVCDLSGGCLNISYDPHTIKIGFISVPSFVFEPFWNTKNPVITVYVPDGASLDEVYFDGGVGNTEIDNVKANSFVINGGVGNYSAKNIYAKNIKIEGGVGDAKIQGKIEGDIKINGGVGNVALDLSGDSNDYSVKSDGGVGSVRINGKPAKNTGGGKYRIDIDGGVGNIDINF